MATEQAVVPTSAARAVPGSGPSKQDDPAGYAAVFLASWLSGDDRDQDGHDSSTARSMAPDVELPRPAADTQDAPELEDVAAVRSVQLRQGVWSVTVAARREGTVRYFSVPVVSRDGRFAVSGGPARIAAPSGAEVPASRYQVPVGAQLPLAQSAEEFFGAYLAGVGEVDRYLAPGARAQAPGGYERVSVRRVAAVEEVAAGTSVPADGTRARVEIAVEAEDAVGVWPLVYRAEMTTRGGRWEVSSLEALGGVR